MKRISTLTGLVLATGLLWTAALAQDAAEIMQKSHLAYYYAGNDGQTDVRMTLADKKGGERIREFTMLRLDKEDGGDQKYYTYFRQPSDVARLTFMVYKSATGNDQRWIYVPSVDLVKPISADDKNSSFVGSDFTYEDVSGRHWTEDKHTLVREDQLNGKAVHVIESVPLKPYKGFAKRLSYIDKTSFLPLKEEYFDDKGVMTRILRADKIEDIDGITTVTIRSMENVKKGSKTTVAFNSIKYNVGLKDDIFTERYLKTPPREYVK
ncbi:MAG: outer membrane lipoprotein-sorting protein [Candidatus Zixiibacteriota bacterium]